MTSDLSPLTFRLSPLASSLRSATKNTRNTKIDQGRAEGKDESGKIENWETIARGAPVEVESLS